MEYGCGVGIAHKLALEKRLLEEEKYIVQTLKKVKQERYGLQIEKMHLFSLLQQVLKKGQASPKYETAVNESRLPKPTNTTQEEVSTQPAAPTEVVADASQSTPATLADEFNLPILDSTYLNDLELNLTVPQHPFYEPEEETEEFEEIENDDYEIEMSMLMNGKFRDN